MELDTRFYGQYRLNQAFSNVVSLFIKDTKICWLYDKIFLDYRRFRQLKCYAACLDEIPEFRKSRQQIKTKLIIGQQNKLTINKIITFENQLKTK